MNHLLELFVLLLCTTGALSCSWLDGVLHHETHHDVSRSLTAPQCGSGAGGVTCVGDLGFADHCCSSSGYCGYTEEFCSPSSGCQSDCRQDWVGHCGDGTCIGRETTFTCPEDCGQPLTESKRGYLLDTDELEDGFPVTSG
jgi:hypothetical protein